jgi:long-chain acyl-CoA synthetase
MLVFNKIKQKLGGRVRVIVSGGAPMSKTIEEFLRVAMCAPVVQVNSHRSRNTGNGAGDACCATVLSQLQRQSFLGGCA